MRLAWAQSPCPRSPSGRATGQTPDRAAGRLRDEPSPAAMICGRRSVGCSDRKKIAVSNGRLRRDDVDEIITTRCRAVSSSKVYWLSRNFCKSCRCGRHASRSRRRPGCWRGFGERQLQWSLAAGEHAVQRVIVGGRIDHTCVVAAAQATSGPAVRGRRCRSCRPRCRGSCCRTYGPASRSPWPPAAKVRLSARSGRRQLLVDEPVEGQILIEGANE